MVMDSLSVLVVAARAAKVAPPVLIVLQEAHADNRAPAGTVSVLGGVLPALDAPTPLRLGMQIVEAAHS